MTTLGGFPRCVKCGPRARGLFCSLTGSHLLKLDRKKVAREYRRGQIIFYEGNPPLAIYCVYSGLVKLYKAANDGKRVIIRLLGPGEVMGYRALLAGEPYAATAEAVDTTTICTIAKDTLDALLKDDPNLTLRLLSKLATELRISEDQMIARTQEPVRQRTARFLLWLLGSLRNSSKKTHKIDVPLLREEMAQMIGTTPETFSRVLRSLSQEGVLKFDRRTISVVRPRGLRQIAKS